ncbi:hypothetical protein Taro_032502 [Colocasia esculenta]|uniref:Uncharacterized protein n=1 Tax=Colocasia esculenta TaxID=4460 RepID=A0A843W9M9_COLES|nr:hypothetical protein [Colocasia esculenta]
MKGCLNHRLPHGGEDAAGHLTVWVTWLSGFLRRGHTRITSSGGARPDVWLSAKAGRLAVASRGAAELRATL